MKDSELRAIAERLDLPVYDIARWHFIDGQHYISKKASRPKGKLKRPKGTLSIGEIIQKYGIDRFTLSEWRRLGIPHRRIGTLIVVNQRVLDQWIEEQWGGDEAQ